MRSGSATLAVVGVAACIAAFAFLSANSAHSTTLFTTVDADELEFLKFVSVHGKSYASKEEFAHRRELFKSNLAKIRAENANPHNTFRLVVNKFADWSPAEYRRLLNSKQPRALQAPTLTSEPERIDLREIPPAIDWRNNSGFSYVNAVKDQGQCGSCWAFSAVGALESRYSLKSGELWSLSEQQLVDCATGELWGSQGCKGGWTNLAFAYAEAYGMMTEQAYPYVAKNQNCSYNASDVRVRNTSFGHYENVTVNSSQALKAAIAQGPVSVSLEADTIPFQFYGGGIFNSPACGLELDHAVVAIGYGTDPKGREYYIVRNSWGPQWGVGGYINIAIVDGPGICGIQMDPVYPVFKTW